MEAMGTKAWSVQLQSVPGFGKFQYVNVKEEISVGGSENL